MRPPKKTSRWALPALALVALLVLAPSAPAQKAGHNAPTRALEASFKIAQLERAGSTTGCYPAPPALAKLIKSRTGRKSAVAASVKTTPTAGIVYVIKKGFRCDHVTMALRVKGELWILNSTDGTVRVMGRGSRNEYTRGSAGPLRGIKLKSKVVRLTKVDQTLRGEVLCGGSAQPLGGGMTSTPPPDSTGEGIYPHSYERLGAQRGWHINPVLIDPTVLVNPQPTDTVARNVTLQVVCGKGLVPLSAPHKNIFTRPGEVKTTIARCPKGQQLITGGFQRSNFKTPGGNYVTESRAIGTNAWQVSGASHGEYGGELTAIAYCDKAKRPLLTTVTANVPFPSGALASVTTPACPKGQRLTSGGFTTNGSKNALFAGGSINPTNTWTATGFAYFGPAPSLTAFGYCLRPGV